MIWFCYYRINWLGGCCPSELFFWEGNGMNLCHLKVLFSGLWPANSRIHSGTREFLVPVMSNQARLLGDRNTFLAFQASYVMSCIWAGTWIHSMPLWSSQAGRVLLMCFEVGVWLISVDVKTYYDIVLGCFFFLLGSGQPFYIHNCRCCHWLVQLFEASWDIICSCARPSPSTSTCQNSSAPDVLNKYRWHWHDQSMQRCQSWSGRELTWKLALVFDTRNDSPMAGPGVKRIKVSSRGSSEISGCIFQLLLWGRDQLLKRDDISTRSLCW